MTSVMQSSSSSGSLQQLFLVKSEPADAFDLSFEPFPPATPRSENHTETEEADDDEDDEIRVLYHVTPEDRDTIALEGPGGLVITRADLIKYGCVSNVPSYQEHEDEYSHQYSHLGEPEQGLDLKGRPAETEAELSQSSKKRRVVPAGAAGDE